MWIVKAALKNPYAVAVLALMIVVLGVISVVSIPVDILPVFKAPAVQVLTYYPGMPASSIEKTITNRIERWVNQAPGVRRIESKSVPGVSVVKLYFREDIDPNAALTLATSLAQGTLATLPPNTLPPVVFPFDPTGTIPLGILTVSNPKLTEAHVKDIGRIDVRNMLGGIKGAVAPVVVGGKDRTILAYVNPRDMWTRKVSPTDVVNALRDGNLMVTPGTAYFGPYQLLLDSNVMVTKVEELNGLPIRMEPGENVYLRDIGEAEDTYSIQTSRVRINGKSQVFVPVYRQGGASSLAVSSGVKSEVPRMEKKLPEGTKLQYVMDQSGYVREAIVSLIHEGIFGAILVSIMILVFLGNARMTLIATMSIPLAILCSIIGLSLTGNTINARARHRPPRGRRHRRAGEHASAPLPGQIEARCGVRRRGRSNHPRPGRHDHHDHRAVPDRIHAGHGRLPVSALDPGGGFRDGCLVPAVPDLRPRAVRPVAGRAHPPGRGARLSRARPAHPPAHRDGP
jgi:multidrug efflux pump subunit AcrB